MVEGDESWLYAARGTAGDVYEVSRTKGEECSGAGGRMIEQVLSLQKDGNEQPQFYLLRFRYAGKGAGYKQTIESGTEAYLREVLTQGGIALNQINQLFTAAH